MKLYLKDSFKSLKWYEWLMAAIMIVIAASAMITAIVNPSDGGNPVWLTIINFISAICGVVCIFFCAKAETSNYIFGIINTLVYAIYLWYWKIYGTFALEMLFYLPTNCVGWYAWYKKKDKQIPMLTTTKKMNKVQFGLSVLSVVVITLAAHFILTKIGGNVVWLDALTVAIGIVATYLQMCRYRESYVWWLVTDVVAVAMYIVQFDPVYLTKKSIYLVMAVIGLLNWAKLQRERNPENT